jgi:hypothetical protein
MVPSSGSFLLMPCLATLLAGFLVRALYAWAIFGSTVNQKIDDLGLAAFLSHRKRCAEFLIFNVNVGPTIQKEVDGFYLGSPHRIIEGCLPIVIDCIWVSTVSHQAAADFHMPLSRTVKDSSLPVGVNMIWRAAQADE